MTLNKNLQSITWEICEQQYHIIQHFTLNDLKFQVESASIADKRLVRCFVLPQVVITNDDDKVTFGFVDEGGKWHDLQSESEPSYQQSDSKYIETVDNDTFAVMTATVDIDTIEEEDEISQHFRNIQNQIPSTIDLL